MEQAVNQFNKGLQSDTHPMVQGNDTLSDALNATFVTMNGNEVVLQNDMGNRRVDNAFLPSGYEPVGIKEYGGIIYVAAYNPITNRSQIGSFPSPERKINSLDDKKLGCNFKLFNHFYTKSQSDTERNFIKTDTVLIPLTGDTSLHAGDKFIIYSSEIENWKQYLSNYDNSSKINKKAKHYKNRHITLSVGVLNSQNQFVDITKNLKRWRNSESGSEIIKYDDTYSESYIFNDGYFISSSGTIKESNSYSIDDRNLIRERQVKPSNTYAYKLTGPLYLKAHLNHIEEFSFDIQGNKTPSLSNKNEGKLELLITANIVYNCPDGNIGGGNTIDDYIYDGICSPNPYQTWDEKNVFDFYIKQNGKYVKQIENINYNYDGPILFNGVYKRTVKFSLKINNYIGLNKNLEYFIGVDSGIPLDQSENKPYYIETLSTYGTLDLSKLGSGEINLKAFRFYNSEQNTTLTYSLETYPKIGQKFYDLMFLFTDVEKNSQFTLPSDNGFPCYNGKNIVSFNWNNKIQSGKLYTVEFMYFTSDSNGQSQFIKNSDGSNTKRWFLSTSLFNDCYNPQSDNFVEDYGEKVHKYNKILYDKLLINLEIEHGGDINVSTSEIIDNSQNLIKSGESGLIDYSNTINYSINGHLDDRLKISNKELYPESLKLLNNILKISTSTINLEDKLEIEVIKNGNVSILEQLKNGNSVYSISYDNNIYDLLVINNTSSNNTISGQIKCNNQLLSNSSLLKGNRVVNNGFNLINSKEFKNIVLENSSSHSGFLVSNYDIWSGGDDEHIFALAIDKPYLTTPVKNQDYSEGVTKFVRKQDGSMVLDFNDSEIAEYYDEMSTSIQKNKTFAYIFSAINTIGNTTSDQGTDTRHLSYVSDVEASGWAGIKGKEGANQGYCPINCCKVWWRNGISDEWVLLNNYTGLFGSSSNMFPEKLNDGKYVYIGKDENFSDSNHNPDYTSSSISNNYYDILYNKVHNEGEIDIASIGGSFVKYGINNLVKEQIADFLDPEKKIIYNMYKETQLSDHDLFTINKNDYIYNRPYSGNIILEFYHRIPEVIVSSENQKNSVAWLKVSDNINNILPFHVSEIKENTHQFVVNVKSNENFENDIIDIIDNNIINNIYIKNGLVRDSLGQRLSGDTIYKLINNELVPLTNPPYKVYRDTDGNYNSLVSINNYIGSSPSLSQYLRASGDEDDGSQIDGDSMTALKFSGGRLRVVNYNTFQNL